MTTRAWIGPCLLMLLAFTNALAQTSLVDVSVDRILAFPERYQGKTLVFRQAWYAGGGTRTFDRYRDVDLYVLPLKLHQDDYPSSVIGIDMPFVASSALVDQLLRVKERHGDLLVDLTGRLEKVEHGVSPALIFRVLAIEAFQKSSHSRVASLVDSEKRYFVFSEYVGSTDEVVLGIGRSLLDAGVDKAIEKDRSLSRLNVARNLATGFSAYFSNLADVAAFEGAAGDKRVFELLAQGARERVVALEDADRTTVSAKREVGRSPVAVDRAEVGELIRRLESGRLRAQDRRRIVELLRQLP